MADRRMTERRGDERAEVEATAEGSERRGQSHDRRTLERFSNQSVKACSEQMQFWLRILFVVISALGLFILGTALSKGIRQAGPGIVASVVIFAFAYTIFTVRVWVKDYLQNESMKSFEVMFEKLMEFVRFAGLFSAIALAVYILTSL